MTTPPTSDLTPLATHFVFAGNRSAAIGATIRAGMPLAPVLVACGLLPTPKPFSHPDVEPEHILYGRDTRHADQEAALRDMLQNMRRTRSRSSWTYGR